MRAARNGRTDVVVKLIEEGADIDMQNVVCCLLLHLTLCMRPQMYGLIICHYTQNGDTALILASGERGTEAVVELVRAGANVNLQNNVCWCCVPICSFTKYCSHVEWRICTDACCQKG